MASATVNRTLVVNLQLSEAEANFVSLLVPNSMYQNPQDEPPREKEMREAIFVAIQNAA